MRPLLMILAALSCISIVPKTAPASPPQFVILRDTASPSNSVTETTYRYRTGIWPFRSSITVVERGGSSPVGAAYSSSSPISSVVVLQPSRVRYSEKTRTYRSGKSRTEVRYRATSPQPTIGIRWAVRPAPASSNIYLAPAPSITDAPGPAPTWNGSASAPSSDYIRTPITMPLDDGRTLRITVDPPQPSRNPW